MIQLTRENTTKATAKAIAVKPRVRIKGFGTYQVMASGGRNYYIVRLWKENNRKMSDCTCQGATRGRICYHVAAAIGAHTVLAAHRNQQVH